MDWQLDFFDDEGGIIQSTTIIRKCEQLRQSPPSYLTQSHQGGSPDLPDLKSTKLVGFELEYHQNPSEGMVVGPTPKVSDSEVVPENLHV